LGKLPFAFLVCIWIPMYHMPNAFF
jgi:hypothetical protein